MRAQRRDQAGARSASAAPQAAAPRAPRDGQCLQRGSDRANDHTQRTRATEYVPRERAAAAGSWRPSVTPSRARRHDQASARSASAAPQVAAPRVPRDGHCPQRGSDCADDRTQRARAAEHVQRERVAAAGPRRPSVTPPRARRHDQINARSASAALPVAAPRAPRDGHCPQRGSDRTDDPTQEARGLSTMHRAERASYRRGAAAAERHAAASATVRPIQRQERQRGAASSGAASAARRPMPPERKRPRRRPHAKGANRQARAERASRRRGGSWWPNVTPPRARRHDQASARNARRRR